MDRRNFLRTGSLAMLGSLAVPSLAMPASVRGALGGADNQSAVASAMVHFGVTEADLKKVMAAALEKGGDYADLYFEHTFNMASAGADWQTNYQTQFKWFVNYCNGSYGSISGAYAYWQATRRGMLMWKG